MTTDPLLTAAQGRLLVAVARHAIAKKLAVANLADFPEPTVAQLSDAVYQTHGQTHGGTFVTLTIGRQLRGCIGSLTGCEPLIQDVRKNALNAAFHDPRFRPLTAAEFPRIHVEVSVLTEPRRLTFKDSTDLIARLRPFVDGVILHKGIACATFLPQVWEQLPRPEDFLSHLCLKANLQPDAWMQEGIKIETYQALVFKEDR